MAHDEHNRREHELTKHISIAQIDPPALIALRASGRCTVQLPESLFDKDRPGDYFRVIESIAVSVQCVVGPNTALNCNLTLLKSSVRKSPQLTDGSGYERMEGAEDTRFEDHYHGVQAIASYAQQHLELFETNLDDERYLPFENAGAISHWQIGVSGNPSDRGPMLFGYSKIADVVLHMRYTSRDGGKLLRNAAMDSVKSLTGEARARNTP